MSGQFTIAAEEWRRGWLLVLAGIVGMATVSIHAYSLGVMVAPLEGEFSWSRSQITSGLLILSLVGIVFNIPMGMAVDRFGPRPVAISGMFTYCGAIAALSLATPSPFVWYALWLLVALGQLQLKPTTWVAAVSRAFDTNRGMALAIVLSGSGIATFLVPIITQALVAEHGWRDAYRLLAGGWALIAIPVVVLFFREPHRKASATAPAESASKAHLPGVGVKEGLLSGNFLRLALAVTIFALASTGIILNLVPILSSLGLDRAGAAALAGTAGIATIVGRLSSGYLLDRFDARRVAGAVVALPVLSAMLLVALPGPAWLALAAVVLLGLAGGAEMDAMAYMAGRFFGMRNLGALFGALMSCMTVGVGLGPVTASLIFDLTGTYEIAIWLLVPMSLAASALFWTMPAYPDFAQPEAG